VTKFLPKTTSFYDDNNTQDYLLIAGGSGIGFLLVMMALVSLCRAQKRRRVYPTNDPEGVNSAMSVVSADDESDGSRPNLSRIGRGDQYKPKRTLYFP
jgi:hypothetical protein